MTNNVFLNAQNAAIVVTVNNTIVANDVQTADALVQVFLTHNINVLKDTIMCSSSIDFASEEDFATEQFDSCHEVPERLQPYIDYEIYQKELFMGGCYSSRDSETGTVFIFDNQA